MKKYKLILFTISFFFWFFNEVFAQGVPKVELKISQPIATPGMRLNVDLNFQGSEADKGDVYLAMLTPDLRAIFFGADTLSEEIIPFMQNESLKTRSLRAFNLFFDLDPASILIPHGKYQLFAGIVIPGGDIRDPNSFIGGMANIAQTSFNFSNVPTLTGIPKRDFSLPLQVKAAFNDQDMFWELSWPSAEGRFHDYFRFTGGKWVKEGGYFREEGRKSTLYEDRVVIMVDDPNSPNNVPKFPKVGCFITCHDDARYMPKSVANEGAKEITKYLPLGETGSLDMWHWRAHRSNPTGFSDDQYVVAGTDADGDGKVDPGKGGRKTDAGNSPFSTTNLTEQGLPPFMFDPSVTGGKRFFNWSNIFRTPLWFISQAEIAPNRVPKNAIAFDATFSFPENAAIPRRLLRDAKGSAGDITSVGTKYDRTSHRWVVRLKRKLNTGNTDDKAFERGKVYNVAFAFHADKAGARDHYVTLPVSLGLSVTGQKVDINAVALPGNTTPDFSDISPVTLDAFLPAVVSWEFVTGVRHVGSAGINAGLGCGDCHNVRKDVPTPLPRPGIPGSLPTRSFEEIIPARGGVFDETPKAH